jgi:Family of unknown function (DUF5419)
MSEEDGSFGEWLTQVDRAIAGYCGLTHRDIADQPWRDWFDDEVPPKEAAEMALEDEGFPFEGE